MTETPAPKPSRIATAAITVGALAAALPAIGILAVHTGLASSPMTGFYSFLAGCLLGGALTLLLGLAGLIATRGGRHPQGQRQSAAAAVLGAGLLALVGTGGAPGAGLPAINDITTNLVDPPQFVGDPSGRERDMTYPDAFVPQVRDAYSDLATLPSSMSQGDAFARAIEAGESLGWEITRRDAARGHFEATDTSAIFRFVDDIVVRITPTSTGSALDIRSKSRDGRGDVGSNATRIRSFANAFHD